MLYVPDITKEKQTAKYNFVGRNHDLVLLSSQRACQKISSEHLIQKSKKYIMAPFSEKLSKRKKEM